MPYAEATETPKTSRPEGKETPWWAVCSETGTSIVVRHETWFNARKEAMVRLQSESVKVWRAK